MSDLLKLSTADLWLVETEYHKFLIGSQVPGLSGQCLVPAQHHVEEEQLRDQEAAPAVSSVLTPPRPRPGPAT